MSEIKKLGETELDELVRIVAQAYPGSGLFSPDARNRLKEQYAQTMQEDTASAFYGLFRENELHGVMKFYDYVMNLHGHKIDAGGIGSVAVDLLRKKEKVAKEMLTFFLHHYRERELSMVLLYPFRVDFYKQMGFGIGTKMNQYRVAPDSLPSGGSKRGIVYVRKEDKQSLVDCYNRYAAQTHGMIDKTEYECRNLFDNPDNIIVGCKQGNELHGYLVFQFKKASADNFGLNDIVVKELIYQTPTALSELLTFLHSQSDQIRQVVFNTLDEHFHHILSDPRNGSDQLLPHVFHVSNVSGVGLMYRVINVQKVFTQLQGRNFGGQTCKVKLTITDSLLPENSGSTIIHFEEGYPTLHTADDFEVEVRLDISEFTSLLMGTVPFSSLYFYGLAQLSDSTYVETINKLFMTMEKPKCTTPF